MQGRQDDFDREADLIGHFLGLCDPAETAAIERALGEDERLIQTRARLARVLAPLDADEPIEAPAHLSDAILARVGQLHRTLPLRPVLGGGEVGGPARPMFNMRELLSLAAVIAIFVGVFVPGYRTARENARIANCASNLNQLYVGGRSYAETYGTQPILATVPEGTSWVTGDSRHATNARNAIALVGGRYVAPSVLICPGRPGDFSLSQSQIEHLREFSDPRNNSYSSNLVSTQAQWQKADPGTPLAADLTPVVNDQRQLRQDGSIPRNSDSHGGKGQNVIKMDGRSIFGRTPNLGLDSDDIYRLIGVQKYTGMERPLLRSDAFLVP